jgi:hypothetical protein
MLTFRSAGCSSIPSRDSRESTQGVLRWIGRRGRIGRRDRQYWGGSSRRPSLVALAIALLGTLGCTDEGKVSAERASAHVRFLAPVTEQDVKEVRAGLPQGTPYLEDLWKSSDTVLDPEAARDALNRARAKVQDLRNAKSTFFAVVEKTGTVVRNDLQLDMMAGKNLLAAFPSLKSALDVGYAEATGTMLEARGTEGKEDGQWVAAAAVKRDGVATGLYVTGWAWTLYARRLEEALKSRLWDEEKGKKPLFYVVIVRGDQVFGTGPSPQVNLDAVSKLEPLKNAKDGHFEAQLEVTGRKFGFAAEATPALGEGVMVGVLRSET